MSPDYGAEGQARFALVADIVFLSSGEQEQAMARKSRAVVNDQQNDHFKNWCAKSVLRKYKRCWELRRAKI